MERYTMKSVDIQFGFSMPFLPNTQPHLHHLQRVFAEDYDCIRAPHLHENTVEVVVIVHGEGVFSVNGLRIPVKAGQTIIYNSNVVHEEQFSNGSDIQCFSISISGLRLQGIREDALIADSDYPCFELGDRYNEIIAIIEAMFHEYAYPMRNSARSAQVLLIALLSILLDIVSMPREIPKQTLESELCRQVINYVNVHFLENITLQQIADDIHFSVSHMCHVFKEQVGYSPTQYILYRRIGEAQTLLETTQLTAAQIGIRTGFADPSYFNSVFRKKVGMSPMKYRRIYSFNQ